MDGRYEFSGRSVGLCSGRSEKHYGQFRLDGCDRNGENSRNPAFLLLFDPTGYAASANNDIIQMQAGPYAGALTFDRTDIPGLSVTLKGGYNATYSDSTGITTVGSPFTIQSGTIIVDHIIIL